MSTKKEDDNNISKAEVPFNEYERKFSIGSNEDFEEQNRIRQATLSNTERFQQLYKLRSITHDEHELNRKLSTGVKIQIRMPE
jgi:hypothetical protein